jgi:sugar/nucleoside kinase (ribokinase family)
VRAPEKSGRRGILCAGNWIIDHVKLISFWPREENLATIVGEETGTGGSAYNVLVDLARFGAGVPLHGLGLVGEDADGRRILADCDRLGIDRRLVRATAAASTAYTDVMSVVATGRRTFFHHRGANALLGPEHFPVEELSCRVANLGYLLLLDALDAPDPEWGTGAARVLARLRGAGIETSIDVVSEDSDRFRKVVAPALPHADNCIVNEIEAGRIAGRELRDRERLATAAVEAAARELLDLGVRRRVVIHAPEGAFGLERDGAAIWRPGFTVPAEEIRGTAGAGDAFMAGMLLGIHEGWDLERALAFASAAAVTCLFHPTTTGGVGSLAQIDAVAARYPLRRL